MTGIWLGIIPHTDKSKENLFMGESFSNAMVISKALAEADHGLNSVAVKRKVIKIDSNGSVDLSFAEWKGNLAIYKKNPRPSKKKLAVNFSLIYV